MHYLGERAWLRLRRNPSHEPQKFITRSCRPRPSRRPRSTPLDRERCGDFRYAEVGLKCEAEAEIEGAEIFVGATVGVHAVVEAEGADGERVAEAEADGVPHILGAADFGG
jgi:hypothetical protein